MAAGLNKYFYLFLKDFMYLFIVGEREREKRESVGGGGAEEE